MPPHNGHLHLIYEALRNCEHVYVMVCHIKSEPIHGKLRVHWLEKIFSYHDRVTIVECDDENPQHPATDDVYDKEFYDIWYKSVYDRIDSLDVVFTSENYGDNFAKCLGVEHFLVDLDRWEFPVSGTMVRDNPRTMWDYIPMQVRGYFHKKIAVIGPESTGKTTMVEKLSEELRLHPMYELGRGYTDSFDNIFDMTVADYENIALQHFIEVNELVPMKDSVVISDTEAIVTKTFGKMYLGDDFESDLIDSIIEKQNYDTYIVLTPSVKWVDDGTRDFPDKFDRWTHYRMIMDEVVKTGKPVCIIDGSGDYDKRYNQVKEIIERNYAKPLGII